MFFNLIKPDCYMCKKEVDEILIDKDFCKNELVINVYCHGERDSMRILSPEIPYIDFKAWEKGYAFTTKHLDKTCYLA